MKMLMCLIGLLLFDATPENVHERAQEAIKRSHEVLTSVQESKQKSATDQNSISLPETITWTIGTPELPHCQATTGAEDVGWHVFSPQFPKGNVPHQVIAASKSLYLTTALPGTYTVVAWTDAAHKSVCQIVVQEQEGQSPSLGVIPARTSPEEKFDTVISQAFGDTTPEKRDHAGLLADIFTIVKNEVLNGEEYPTITACLVRLQELQTDQFRFRGHPPVTDLYPGVAKLVNDILTEAFPEQSRQNPLSESDRASFITLMHVLAKAFRNFQSS